jgi:hypothetical protein
LLPTGSSLINAHRPPCLQRLARHAGSVRRPMLHPNAPERWCPDRAARWIKSPFEGVSRLRGSAHGTRTGAIPCVGAGAFRINTCRGAARSAPRGDGTPPARHRTPDTTSASNRAPTTSRPLRLGLPLHPHRIPRRGNPRIVSNSSVFCNSALLSTGCISRTSQFPTRRRAGRPSPRAARAGGLTNTRVS